MGPARGGPGSRFRREVAPRRDLPVTAKSPAGGCACAGTCPGGGGVAGSPRFCCGGGPEGGVGTEAQGLGPAQEGGQRDPLSPQTGELSSQCGLPALVRDQAAAGQGPQRAGFCPPGEPLLRPTPPLAFIEFSICESPRPVQISAFYFKPASHPGRLFGKRRRGSALFTGIHRQRSRSHAPSGSPTLKPLHSALTLPYLPWPQV